MKHFFPEYIIFPLDVTVNAKRENIFKKKLYF